MAAQSLVSVRFEKTKTPARFEPMPSKKHADRMLHVTFGTHKKQSFGSETPERQQQSSLCQAKNRMKRGSERWLLKVSWQDFLVQYLERVQYSGFKPCAVSRVTRYKIYAIMSFLCCTYYPNRAVCTPLHGLQLTHCSIGSASLEFGFSISNQQGALVSLKPLAGYAAGVHYLLCE